MTGEHAVRRVPTLLRLHLSEHLIHTFPDGELATVQSAVALLRTLFEDHHVDPEHQSCLFFHGCILGGKRADDFSVVHRGDQVILSDFTFPYGGPRPLIMPLRRYALAVVRFAGQVLSGAATARQPSVWSEHYVKTQMQYLRDLHQLGRRLIIGPYEEYAEIVAEFQASHGSLKQPLQLQVLAAPEATKPWQPVEVLGRVEFGPVRTGEVLPMRLNQGDVVLVTVEGFRSEGVALKVEGVGTGGIRAGDWLRGLQLFYP